MIKFLDLQKINNLYNEELHQAVSQVINSGWYLFGKELESFEEKYARYIGTDFCIGVGNGLDALRLILRSYIELGVLNEGDEIIVPANTYIASILSITDNKLKPILVEPDIFTLQIDTTKIEKVITPKTKGIMIVHLYGRCSYNEDISNLCSKYGLLLIEDNAQAAGCMYKNKKTGSLGDAAGHSFYPGKNLGALSDAGAVTTNNKLVADTVRTLANYGSSKKYLFEYQGINSRLNEINASVLNVKLKYLDRDNFQRRNLAKYYINHIKHNEILLPSNCPEEENTFHIFPILIKRRDQLQQYLL